MVTRCYTVGAEPFHAPALQPYACSIKFEFGAGRSTAGNPLSNVRPYDVYTVGSFANLTIYVISVDTKGNETILFTLDLLLHDASQLILFSDRACGILHVTPGKEALANR
jgi:hypothetical protein